MTATNMCSNFGSKWCNPPVQFEGMSGTAYSIACPDNNVMCFCFSHSRINFRN